jgi:hypothetical protein
MKDYPPWICDDCGTKYGSRIPLFATYHYGDQCGWCEAENKAVTEPRDYGWPKHGQSNRGEGMSEMIERVARAICYANCLAAHPGDIDRALTQADSGWDLWVKEARAAIEAMRYEDGIDEDLAIEIGGRNLGVDAVGAIEIHEAWIDAALSGSNQDAE